VSAATVDLALPPGWVPECGERFGASNLLEVVDGPVDGWERDQLGSRQTIEGE
jgi:hypothetical protein